nr:PREDICTED: uncharacterized protein LOC103314035 [Tribolium castaneum]|eukprot:XP_015840155.1 PREDICTED: uncharacterized protein LOC103314035 [Tribolium castaneum]
MRCAVFGCKVDDQAKHFKKREVRFFRFPSDPQILKAWVKACSRKDNFNTANARVCSKHFQESDYKEDLKCKLLGYSPKNRRLMKPGVVPTQNLVNKPSSSSECSPSAANERRERAEKRKHSALVKELLDQQVEKENCGGAYGGGMLPFENVNENIMNSEAVTKRTKLRKDVGTSTERDDRDAVIAQLKQQVSELKSEFTILNQFFLFYFTNLLLSSR